MSSLKPSASHPDETEPQPKGPNLVLYFTLVALALATAIGLALLIVRPFYDRH